METLEQIKELTELLSVDTTKFYGGNKNVDGGFFLLKTLINKEKIEDLEGFTGI